MNSLVKVVLTAAVLATSLTACVHTPMWAKGGADESGMTLSAGEEAIVHFFTRDPSLDTGVKLAAGTEYEMDITILSLWVDSTIRKNENGEPLDETGFADSVMPHDWVSFLKRSGEHRWFELMIYQPNCSRDSLRGVTDLNANEDSGSYNFVAACDGKLSLFVNDSHGYYSNNVGFANIALSQVN